MKSEDLVIEDWCLVNKKTGEHISIDLLNATDGGIFNKIFICELAQIIGCTGNGSEKVLGWILKNKNSKNEIHGTQREIAHEENVGVATVSRVFTALSKNGYLKIKRSGTYILNPQFINHDSKGNGMTILKIWNNLT